MVQNSLVRALSQEIRENLIDRYPELVYMVRLHTSVFLDFSRRVPNESPTPTLSESLTPVIHFEFCSCISIAEQQLKENSNDRKDRPGILAISKGLYSAKVLQIRITPQ